MAVVVVVVAVVAEEEDEDEEEADEELLLVVVAVTGEGRRTDAVVGPFADGAEERSKIAHVEK